MFKKAAFVAGALCCLSLPSFAAEECASAAYLADTLSSADNDAELIEVVPINTQSVDNLVIFRTADGTVLMMIEFEGCLFGPPTVIDVKRKEFGA